MPNTVLDSIVKKALGKADVMLSVCSHRWFDIDAMTSAMQLFGSRKHSFTWAPVRGDALISRARNRIASFFLKSNCDVLLFLDDDVVFKAEDAIRLVDKCMSGHEIIGGMYIQKKTLEKTAVFFDGQSVEFSLVSKPQEVMAMPTGFLAIHRSALEKMIENKSSPLGNGDQLVWHCYEKDPGYAYYTFFNPFTEYRERDGQVIDLGEDWAFCSRARKLGIKVWLDPSIFLGHKGEHVYDLADKIREPKKTFESLTLK